MGTAAVAHLAAAAAYAGFQVTVRLVVYPQLATAADAGAAQRFAVLEEAHGRRVARLVGPLFAALVGTTAWLVVAVPADDRPLALLAAACTAVVLGVTALGAVPQHRRLGRGWDAAAHRRLLRWDAVRAVAAVLQAAVGVVLLL